MDLANFNPLAYLANFIVVLFKKMQTPANGEDTDDSRKWDDLPPEILGKIFEPLPIADKFGAIPLVCKPWGEAVKGPYCWRQVDLEDWTSWYQVPWKVDKMLRILTARSCGTFRKLCVCKVSNPSSISFLADNLCSSLDTLKLPGCLITDSWVQNVAGNLANVTFLDLSYCNRISSAGLEIIGKACFGLIRLHRNMHTLDVERKLCQKDEARAIANTMPNLQHLELQHAYIGTKNVMQIVNGCPRLEFLDVEGCWNVRLDEDCLKISFPNLHVRGPAVGGDDEDFIIEHYNMDQPLPDTSDDDHEGPYEDFRGHIVSGTYMMMMKDPMSMISAGYKLS